MILCVKFGLELEAVSGMLESGFLLKKVFKNKEKTLLLLVVE